MKHCVLLTLSVMCVFAASMPAGAETFEVPVPYATIQDGVNAAGEGDTVKVAPGTYSGLGNRDVEFNGANIVVMSDVGAPQTIIDCEGLSAAFVAFSDEDSTCVIRGFTITNGSRTNGGAISVSHSAVTIEDCVIHGNSASNGGGIYYAYASTQGFIRNCMMYGNTASYRGGAISCDHGYAPGWVPPVIRDCIIYDNEESTENTYGGGGIYCSYSDATIVGCTVVGNSGEPGRGAIYGSSCYPVVRRTVSAFNLTGPGIYNVDADHCVIYGNAGDTPQSGGERENLDVDPLFCDIGSWDLTLCDDSICIAGDPENPWGEQVGALGAGCGSCDTPVEEATWGAIKAMYLSP